MTWPRSGIHTERVRTGISVEGALGPGPQPLPAMALRELRTKDISGSFKEVRAGGQEGRKERDVNGAGTALLGLHSMGRAGGPSSRQAPPAGHQEHQARPPPQTSLRPPGRSLSLGLQTEVLRGLPGSRWEVLFGQMK